jgi:hypothetical protein
MGFLVNEKSNETHPNAWLQLHLFRLRCYVSIADWSLQGAFLLLTFVHPWFLRLGQWSRAFGRPFLAGILWGIWRVFLLRPNDRQRHSQHGFTLLLHSLPASTRWFSTPSAALFFGVESNPMDLTPKACLKKPARLSNVQHRKSLPPNTGGGKRFHASQKSNATFSEQRE